MTITGAALLAGVMGWPVAHSRSPVLHNFWLHEHGIDGVYMGVPVILGAGGVERVVTLELTAPEREGLDASADAVRELIEAMAKAPAG